MVHVFLPFTVWFRLPSPVNAHDGLGIRVFGMWRLFSPIALQAHRPNFDFAAIDIHELRIILSNNQIEQNTPPSMASNGAATVAIAGQRATPFCRSIHSSLGTDQKQAKFDLAISLILSNWEALAAAVQNGWGGPDSEDKRDWFAGAISELFTSNPSTDGEDVEDVLLQVMADEFDVGLEDGSEVMVAATIMKVKEEIESSDFATVNQMWEAFKNKKTPKVKAVRVGPTSDSEDSVDEESDDEDRCLDAEMTDAPEPRKPKEKPIPEVDDEGFTKVVSRRR